jgi:hypothetical protein
MTEEEAFFLDEYYTNNPPTVDPAKARIHIPIDCVTFDTSAYLSYEARKIHSKPEETLDQQQ